MLAIGVLALLAVVVARLEPAHAPVSGNARASDGDSFRLGDDRIRLLGIDAPELAQLCQQANGADWSCGKVARDRMAELLSTAPVQCQPEDTDRYQRLLARCSVGETDLGAILVSEGLATSTGDYWREEAEAKSAGRGIWQGGFDLRRNWRDDPRGQGLLGLGFGFL